MAFNLTKKPHPGIKGRFIGVITVDRGVHDPTQVPFCSMEGTEDEVNTWAHSWRVNQECKVPEEIPYPPKGSA